MKSEIETMIDECDESLRTLRAFWMDAPDDEKAGHMIRIDRLLDQRLRLMSRRDATK